MRSPRPCWRAPGVTILRDVIWRHGRHQSRRASLAATPPAWQSGVAHSAAAAEYHGALPLLLTFDTLPPRSPLPTPLRWQPAIAWLLGDELPRGADKGRGPGTK